MKSVLISIQPKWCGLIASGKKTVEVRKTRPKIDTPFKCYIYCTSSNVHDCLMVNESGTKRIATINYKTAIPCGGYIGNGKVIGEFVCDAFEFYTSNCTVFESVLLPSPNDLEEMCLTLEEFNDYGTRGKLLYGWHISDLVIYDKPKELSEFKKIDRECWYADLGLAKRDCHECQNKGCLMQRPPQSWCYVEELKGGAEG